LVYDCIFGEAADSDHLEERLSFLVMETAFGLQRPLKLTKMPESAETIITMAARGYQRNHYRVSGLDPDDSLTHCINIPGRLVAGQ